MTSAKQRVLELISDLSQTARETLPVSISSRFPKGLPPFQGSGPLSLFAPTSALCFTSSSTVEPWP